MALYSLLQAPAMYKKLAYRSNNSQKSFVIILAAVFTIVLFIAIRNYNGRNNNDTQRADEIRRIIETVRNTETTERDETVSSDKTKKPDDIPDWEKDLDFTDFNNETGTADGHYIVPNYVHFLRFGNEELSFVHMICILSAFKHQKPDKLFLHTDNDKLEGRYWDILKNTPGFMKVFVVEKMTLPTEIFGQKLNAGWATFHGGDVARILVMMKYGGIYLDADSYIIRNMNDLRRYEMVVSWRLGEPMGNQVFVAHKNARYLKLWLDSYHEYRPNDWYYNAAIRPTQEVLNYQPHLVHRVPGNLLGVYNIIYKLYLEKWKDWREYYSVHVMARHQYMLNRNLTDVATFPVVFNETNIKLYPNTFRDMVQDVFDIGMSGK